MKANSDKSKQSNKATRRVLAGVLCGASVLSLVLSLVMPPISQAIANDAQTVFAEGTVMGGGSSSESTDVENTTNGDAENQNSDETESGETGSSNDVEQNQAEDQLEGELQVEDGGSSNDDAVMAAAEGGQTETAANEITSANDLDSKLKAVGENGTASFDLTMDVECGSTIQLDKSGSNITLNLNGHKIKYTNQSQPLFNITGGATLTIKDTVNDSDPEKTSEKVDDGKLLDDQGQILDRNNYGKEAKLGYDADGIPSNLTYYVTQSSPSATDTTKTTETLFEHRVEIKGAIVACGGNENLKLIYINGGHFSLENGVLTQEKDSHVRSLVYAENKSTVNMNGGYVCGGYCRNNGAGAGISVYNSPLSISDGVIAGNRAPSGGGVYANGSAVTVTGGVISGNSTLNNINGFGGGLMAEGGSVTVSGGYITNNRYAKFCSKDGWGCHGGAGLAAKEGAHVTISGGQITGNYSEEAGGGVYVTDQGRGGSRKDMAWLKITRGIIASNVSYKSEGAGIRVGQKVDAEIKVPPNSSPVYITNNHCMSRFDWGGGGIFVQGSNETASDAGRLFVYNSYISSNTAGGYGGGVAVCPTGKTLVTDTDGTAIFGNTSAEREQSYESYEKGNNGTPHLSGGGHEKNQDYDAYCSDKFRNNGHADFFLAAKENKEPIAAVIGKMLGGGDAEYSGSKELAQAITIPANGGVQVYKSIGLSSGVQAGDPAATTAQSKATTFITGNYSWNHGGGIMSNGDLYLGQPADTYVYPSLKLKASKTLSGRDLKDGEFSFMVYRKGSDDPFAKGTFNRDACTEVGTANNNANGNITFNLGEQFAANSTAGPITYYLVENAGTDSDITYDPAVYEIVVTVEDHSTVLMSVPTRDDPNKTMDLKIHNYEIKDVSAVEHSKGETDSQNVVVERDATEGYYSIVDPGKGKTFTNKYTPYTSSGSWTPKATKVVKGGEMKEFTLQLATDKEFTEIVQNKSTKTDAGKSQTLSFDEIKYELKDLEKLASDSTGRGASNTFTYYVREQQPTTPFTNYTYDQSVYQITVNAVDDSNHKINISATYKQIQDRDGNPVTTDKPHDLTDSTPTFTNTYSTSLPLSGMSGVTLTYLAGAAVLCAAAAWMHIRRKANAKGGERRE